MQSKEFHSSLIKNNWNRSNLAVLQKLRGQIARIEGHEEKISINNQNTYSVSFGDNRIDEILPWNGLPLTGLHEIFGDTAAIGFTLMLISKILNKNSDESVIWCQHKHKLNVQGLSEFGINLNQLVLAEGKNDNDILWAMEDSF